MAHLPNELVLNQLRLLTFREFRPNLRDHWKAYLAFGLFWTWLAGVGRYWDNPRAELWQTLGLGSLAYVFLLSLLLWLIIWPLRPRNWSYRNVLIFISLTAMPAVLYAIPVELFMSLENARTANMWFLIVVATWRVALLWVFLRRAAGLSGITIAIATLMPITLIVVALTALNLEHVVFNIMAGIRNEERSANDAAYGVLVLITFLAVWTLPLLLFGYIWKVIETWRRRKDDKPA